MKTVKIEPITDLVQVHTAFNFFKGSFFQTTQTELLAFLPMSEIYQSMIENIQTKNKIQFLAVTDDEPVGCVICQTVENNKGLLIMPILAVKHEYRGEGIATLLLEALMKQAKKKKFTRLKSKSTETSVCFFNKHGFKPFLYAKMNNKTEYLAFKKAMGKTNQLVDESIGPVVKLKYALTDEFDESTLLDVKSKFKNIKYQIYYEKNI